LNRIEEEKRAIKRPLTSDFDDDRSRDRKRSTGNDRRIFDAPPPPRFDSTLNRFVLKIVGKKFIIIYFYFRSSHYERNDRDRDHSSDVKKRLDDYPKRGEDNYSSKSRDDYKRDSYKSSSGRDDYKRDLDLPRGTYGSSSNSSRMDTSASSSSMNKDRYSDRHNSSSGDYRNTSSRNDDSRNGSTSSKSRYFDNQSSSYDSRQNTALASSSSSSWYQQGSNINTSDIWATKQQDNGVGWNRNGNSSTIDDSRNDYSRFGGSGNDGRKMAPQYNMDAQSNMRSNQYMGSGSSNLMPTASSRFNTNQRPW
jgi:hypothetical protein